VIRLIRAFLDICMFRAVPQDIPASVVLLRICLAIYVASGIPLLLDQAGWAVALGRALIDAVVLLMLIYTVLRSMGRTARFTQTVTALLGTGVILNLLALPLIFLTAEAPVQGEPVLPYALLLGLLFWSLAIFGHISRHALEAPMAVGVLFGLLYLLVSYSAAGLLLPLSPVEGH